jgi:hypothetical protein
LVSPSLPTRLSFRPGTCRKCRKWPRTHPPALQRKGSNFRHTSCRKSNPHVGMSETDSSRLDRQQPPITEALPLGRCLLQLPQPPIH